MATLLTGLLDSEKHPHAGFTKALGPANTRDYHGTLWSLLAIVYEHAMTDAWIKHEQVLHAWQLGIAIIGLHQETIAHCPHSYA
eukprot:365122-Chlamydomonas_euryale.AAC.42